MGFLKFDVHTEGYKDIIKSLDESCTEAQHLLAIQIAKDTSPFVPMRTGSLDQRTRVIKNSIIYPGPYARYLYYGEVYVDPITKAAGFLDKDDQWKSRKGVKKIPSGRKLKISKAVHKQATSFWFEASKAQNLEKWLRLAKEDILHDSKK